MTSYTDIHDQKIRNAHLCIAASLGFMAYAYLITTDQMIIDTHFLINILISVSIGLLLYFTDCWGAGDAKLFMVLCLLTPSENYSSVLLFPSVALFVNIFLISLPIMILLTVRAASKDKEKILKNLFSLKTAGLMALRLVKKLSKSFLTIFSLRLILQSAMDRLLPQLAPVYLAALLFASYQLFRWLMKKIPKKPVIFLLIGLGILIQLILKPGSADFSRLLSVSQLKIIFLYTILFESIATTFNQDEPDDNATKSLPFAPLMLLGTLLTHSPFLTWVIQLLKIIRK